MGENFPASQSKTVEMEATPPYNVQAGEYDFKVEVQSAKAKAEQERKDAEEGKRNCEDARNQLNALESGQRMSRVDASGERIPLDDEMRAQEIEKARKSVQSWCK